MTAAGRDERPRFFEDYPVGRTVECGSIGLNGAEIAAFARQFDPQPFHLDERAAAAGPFGGLVASGWHTASLVTRLFVTRYLSSASSLGSPGIDELRWLAPAYLLSFTHAPFQSSGGGCFSRCRQRSKQRRAALSPELIAITLLTCFAALALHRLDRRAEDALGDEAGQPATVPS